MSRHPMFWGFALGVAAMYIYEHYFTAPKMPTGKYAKGGHG